MTPPEAAPQTREDYDNPFDKNYQPPKVNQTANQVVVHEDWICEKVSIKIFIKLILSVPRRTFLKD